MASIEGKSNAAVIRYRDGVVRYSGLALPVMFDPRDRDCWQKEALTRRVKYCRIVRREHVSRTRWAVRLVLEGRPPRKTRYVIGNGAVGLDYGPLSIAAVGEGGALLAELCPTVEEPAADLRRVRRGMDRSRRATNPANYTADGTVKMGRKRWHKSNRYKARQRQAAHFERKLAAERKRSHGELANAVLCLGNRLQVEDHGVKAMQRGRYGRSVKRRACRWRRSPARPRPPAGASPRRRRAS
jgi:putative transposase